MIKITNTPSTVEKYLIYFTREKITSLDQSLYLYSGKVYDKETATEIIKHRQTLTKRTYHLVRCNVVLEKDQEWMSPKLETS